MSFLTALKRYHMESDDGHNVIHGEDPNGAWCSLFSVA